MSRERKNGCDIVIDTSIAWAAANHRMQKALRRFFGQLKDEYKVCYTEFTLFEIAITSGQGFRARSILDSIADYAKTGYDPSRTHRFKAYRSLGVNDIMIALVAAETGAILATGDWPQARFYMDKSGRKPLYIPLRHL